jgi:hypothetical protein
MTMCKLVSTPLATGGKLASYIGIALGEKDSTLYKSKVGALKYLTLTCPDIAFAINKVCQFHHAPNDLHWVGCEEDTLVLDGMRQAQLEDCQEELVTCKCLFRHKLGRLS